ncbi:tripartite tricarboxylate transporter TctB family protein [Telmatospirillum sp. J64-1]|uniref:tripartite tricarboxylate transporter TctB family protein n=1 Tax=Telmatospirillum sp. J64-1 TaxID=2502183 RepID=UPI00115E7689|nr:tripartite tricarboxylate transporter TctB family protein [Telmatospirillum sp. J64-1]
MGRISSNQIIALIMAAFSVAYLIGAYNIPAFPIPRPIDSDLIPKVLGFSMLVLSVILFFQRDKGEERDAAAQDTEETARHRRRVIEVLVTIVAVGVYAAVLRSAGFVLASALLVGGLAWFYGFRRIFWNIGVSIGVPLALYLIMTRGMDIFLPPGILPI